jgi:hypothetical protein
LATAGDGTIRLWDARNGRLLETWKARQGVYLFGFSPDGKRLAGTFSQAVSVGYDVPGIEIWGTDAGRAVLRLQGHTQWSPAGMFGSDGRRFFTCSADRTARLWETFPWREAEYPGPVSLPLAERVERYAREYWRLRMAAQDRAASQSVTNAIEPPRPPDRSRWPRRDSKATPAQIDLTEHYTGLLTRIFHTPIGEISLDDTLVNLPSGTVAFSNVIFDVRGVIQLRRFEPGLQPYRLSWARYPAEATGIRIGQRCRRVHVLHGVCILHGYFEAWEPVPDDTIVGSYVLHYADGSQRELEIVYGRDVRDWWYRTNHPQPDTDRASIVWTGTNWSAEYLGAKLRLYLRTYENPRPDIEVTSLDFVSKMTQAAPFLVALTVEP